MGREHKLRRDMAKAKKMEKTIERVHNAHRSTLDVLLLECQTMHHHVRRIVHVDPAAARAMALNAWREAQNKLRDVGIIPATCPPELTHALTQLLNSARAAQTAMNFAL